MYRQILSFSLCMLPFMSDIVWAQNVPAANPAVAASVQQMTAATFGQQLAAKAGCTPTTGRQCEITANNLNEMFTFIRFCSQLPGWAMHFQYLSTLLLTFQSNGTGCDLIAIDTHFPNQPTSVTCNLTSDQVAQIVNSLSGMGDINKVFTPEQPVSNDLLSKVKPIADCFAPMNKMTTYTPLTPRKPNPGANPGSNPNPANPVTVPNGTDITQ